MASEKQRLQAVMKAPGNNKCIDCDAPYPQWASANVGVFMCLECSGVHRGLGVQVSFVRSCAMDKWTVSQIQRMELGGNTKATEFFKTYPGYRPGMPIKEKYNSEFAEDYREKLAAECDGSTWVKTERKPKPTATNTLSRTSSPASFSSSSNPGQGAIGSSESQKHYNETFFASMGSKNATRSSDVPPSQGGKYVGFGSAPVETEKTGRTALDGLTQADDPLAMLSRGWGFFSKTVASTAKTVQEQYIQPGLERIQDPKFSEEAKRYVDGLGQKVQEDAKYAYNSASRFVEGQAGAHPQSSSATSKATHETSAESRKSEDWGTNDW